jgi:dolichol-phosphate mannosyltransferase
VNDLTIVLPTLNEAGNIGPLVTALKAAFDAPVLVIDGGSQDATSHEAFHTGARVIVNMNGYAASVMQGLGEGNTTWVLVMDADGSHSVEDAQQIWAAREEADLVIGSRFVKGGASRGTTLRRFLSRMLALMFAVLARLPARDVSSGFRLYRREFFVNARPTAKYFEIQPALLAYAKHNHARVREVPVRYLRRGKGRSKARVFRYGLAFLGALWRLRKQV